MLPQANKGPWNAKGVRIEPGRIFKVNFPPPVGEHTAVVTMMKEGPAVEVIYGVSEPRPGGDRDEYIVRMGTADAVPFAPWIRNDTHFRVEHVRVIDPAIVGEMVGKGRVLAITQTRLEVVARAARLKGLVQVVVCETPPAPPAPIPVTPGE